MRAANRSSAFAHGGVVPVFAITATTLVGGGLLALPIALAPFGVVLALAMVVVMGIVSTIALTGLAVAFTRSSASLTATDRLKTLVRQRFGDRVAMLSVVVNVAYLMLVLIAYGIGIGGTMSTSIGGTSYLWATVFVVLASMLVVLNGRRVLELIGTAVSIVNFCLVVALLMLLASNIDSSIVMAPATADWRDPVAWAPVFGTLVCVYAGFAGLAGLVAPSMRTDPTGRSLVRGVVWAMVAATVIYSLWVVVTLGSIPAADFADQNAAGIDLIAATAGPGAEVVGTLFVAIAMGMAGLTISLALADLVTERLPARHHFEAVFTPGLSVEAFDDSLSGAGLTLNFAANPTGPGLRVRARWGRTYTRHAILDESWDSTSLCRELGLPGTRRWVGLTRVPADDGAERWQVQSTMAVRIHRPQPTSGWDVLGDDAAAHHLLVAVTRDPRTITELTHDLRMPPDEVSAALARLKATGHVVGDSTGRWHAVLGVRRHSDTANARRLVGSYAADSHALSAPKRTTGRWRWLSSPFTARIAGVVPLVIALLLIVVCLQAGVSYTIVIAMVGIVGALYLGNVLPLLLAMAAKISSDLVPPRATRWAPTWLMAGLVAVLGGLCAVYAAVIYRDPLLRLGAAAGSIAALAAAWWAWRSGGFRPRAVVVVEVDSDRRATVRCVDGTAAVPVIADATLPPPGQVWRLCIVGGVRHDLRVVARCGDAPPTALGDCRVSWPGGHQLIEPPPDIAGVTLPDVAGPHDVRLAWDVV